MDKQRFFSKKGQPLVEGIGAFYAKKLAGP